MFNKCASICLHMPSYVLYIMILPGSVFVVWEAPCPRALSAVVQFFKPYSFMACKGWIGVQDNV